MYGVICNVANNFLVGIITFHPRFPGRTLVSHKKKYQQHNHILTGYAKNDNDSAQSQAQTIANREDHLHTNSEICNRAGSNLHQ